MEQRVQWIDAVKGVGILLVILAHISPISNKVFWYLTYGFMPIFFVMAGFTSKSVCGYSEAIKKKAKRLLVPYFVYGLLLIVASSLLFGNTNMTQALLGLAYGRYSLFPEGAENVVPLLKGCLDVCPFWFLPCMFLAYLLLIIYDNLGGQRYIFVSMAVVLTLLSVYKPILLPWSIDTCFMAFLFILTGRFLSKKINKNKGKYDLSLLIICGIVYLLLCKSNPHVNFCIGKFGEHQILSVFLFFALGLAEPLALAFLFRLIEKTKLSSMFAYLGRHSLRLMCIHVFIANVVGIFLDLHTYWTLAISLCLIMAVDAILDYGYVKFKYKYSILNYL